jgi:hypothetical protein
MTVESGGVRRAKGFNRGFWIAMLMVGVLLIVASLVIGRWYGALVGLALVASPVFHLFFASERGVDPSASGIQRLRKSLGSGR